jgi:alpha-beta hydrolase superfamily lysophospholipase
MYMYVGLDFLYPYRKLVVPVMVVLSKFFPTLPASYLSYEEMLSDEEALKHLHHDPRRFHGYLLSKTVAEVLTLIKKAREIAVLKFNLPFLALHGAEDKVCLPAGAQLLYDSAATPVEKKKLEFLPGMKHEFMHDGKVAGARNVEKVVAFLEEQVNSK